MLAISTYFQPYSIFLEEKSPTNNNRTLQVELPCDNLITIHTTIVSHLSNKQNAAHARPYLQIYKTNYFDVNSAMIAWYV